jgi:hypothetical protein
MEDKRLAIQPVNEGVPGLFPTDGITPDVEMRDQQMTDHVTLRLRLTGSCLSNVDHPTEHVLLSQENWISKANFFPGQCDRNEFTTPEDGLGADRAEDGSGGLICFAGDDGPFKIGDHHGFLPARVGYEP